VVKDQFARYTKGVDIAYIVTVLIIILFSMTLHEAMHAFMGYWLGDDTAKLEGRLTLNPIRHIDPFLTILLPLLLAIFGGPIFGGAKPVPFNPSRVRGGEWGSALIAAAGPLLNLLIAFVAFGVAALTGVVGEGGNANGLLAQVLLLTISINVGFFVFNMLPIPPLDGSRVLYALAPEFVRRGMEIMEQFGLIIIFALVFLGGAAFSALLTTLIGGTITIFELIFI